MAKQRHEELTGQGCADAAGGFARLLVRVVQDRKEVEVAAAKAEIVNFPELEIPRRIHADEENIGIGRMKGDEIADVGFETADLFTARIEWMDQADLVAGS